MQGKLKTLACFHVLFLLLGLLCKPAMPKFNPLKDIPSLSGKVAIVTGGKCVFVSTVLRLIAFQSRNGLPPHSAAGQPRREGLFSCSIPGFCERRLRISGTRRSMTALHSKQSPGSRARTPGSKAKIESSFCLSIWVLSKERNRRQDNTSLSSPGWTF
jgi:hypothetical protein